MPDLLNFYLEGVGRFRTFDIFRDGDGMSDEYLTDDEWRVKTAFDLGGVEQLAPNKFMMGDEDVTNQIISIILKRRHADSVSKMQAFDEMMGKAVQGNNETENERRFWLKEFERQMYPAVLPVQSNHVTIVDPDGTRHTIEIRKKPKSIWERVVRAFFK